jgi:hypothetical protein
MTGETVRAALGITVKSGWASAILLEEPVRRPRVVDSSRVELSDPEIPDARQPYHDGFATARRPGRERTRLLASVKRFGKQSVSSAIREYRSGHLLSGVGIVVGSLIDPESIANEHIRIHAREGELFRSVVADAATQSKLARWIWRERDLVHVAAELLGQTEPKLRLAVAALGRTVPGSWRAEQKAAALAAWLVLVQTARPE